MVRIELEAGWALRACLDDFEKGSIETLLGLQLFRPVAVPTDSKIC
jgi:hypothetical protein